MTEQDKLAIDASTTRKIAGMRRMLKQAHKDFHTVIAFHETWRPMVFDGLLRERMGVSFATNTFSFIRVALRREVILGICRLWDTTKGTCRLVEIARSLRDRRFIHALAVNLRRVDPNNPTSAMNRAILAAVIADLERDAQKAWGIVSAYADGAHLAPALKAVKKLRNEQLAHLQEEPAAVAMKPPIPDATDQQIDKLYEDTSALITLLLHIVSATAVDLKGSAEVFGNYSRHFWTAAKGERTPGHPEYRAPFQDNH